MAEQDKADTQIDQEPPSRPGAPARTVVVLVVVALLAGVLAAKILAPAQPSETGTRAAAHSVTSVRNDARADYEAAIEAGKPVYVLFHSLS